MKVKIFKFGGASVKDASSITNVAKLLKNEGYRHTFLVISAMGKMTNAFEHVLHTYFNEKDHFENALEKVKRFHLNILESLFNKKHHIYDDVDALFDDLLTFFNQNIVMDYDYVYDQTVIYGELLSTKILSAFLKDEQIDNKWIDARQLIITNDKYRDASVDWKETCGQIKLHVPENELFITQGFIAKSKNGNSTTLGREGSDYSAAILAHCLDAKEVTIWKDVPGLLNADPRYFNKTELVKSISYQDTLEMAFYGASVIHPKTIKPLQNKNIPLKIRSFSDTGSPGSLICESKHFDINQTCYTKKEKQILIHIQTHDFSFILEKNTAFLFSLLDKYNIKLNLIQNSAISIAICIEDPYHQLKSLVKALEKKFHTQVYESVNLFSIFYYQELDNQSFLKGKRILLRQQNENTIHFVTD